MTVPEISARSFALLLLLLAVASIVAFAFQRSLIYYPEPADLNTLLPHAARKGFLPWTDPQARFIGWRSHGLAEPPLLMLHGNAGHALYRSQFVERIREAGVTAPVFILEYPGYGARPGKPSESTLVAAAIEAIDLIDQRLVLVGESLGTGVACEAAVQRPDKILGLLLVTPFDSLVTVAKWHYPWAPAGLVLRDRYDSATALQKMRTPVSVIVAEQDAVVPPNSGISLFGAYSGPKRLWRVAGCGHNQVLHGLSDLELRAACAFAGVR